MLSHIVLAGVIPSISLAKLSPQTMMMVIVSDSSAASLTTFAVTDAGMNMARPSDRLASLTESITESPTESATSSEMPTKTDIFEESSTSEIPDIVSREVISTLSDDFLFSKRAMTTHTNADETSSFFIEFNATGEFTTAIATDA